MTERKPKRRTRERVIATSLALFNEFGDEARERRLRAIGRFGENPDLMLSVLAVMVGPENVDASYFTEDARQRILH